MARWVLIKAPKSPSNGNSWRIVSRSCLTVSMASVNRFTSAAIRFWEADNVQPPTGR